MSKEIICPECQTANAPGSKFCNNCGERLPPSTSLICPNCSTPNPRNRFYCDNCGTRLVKDDTPKAEEPEEDQRREPDTGSFFSLPVRPPGETGDLDPLQIVPDWLKQQEEESDEDVPRQHMPKIEDVGTSKKVTDDLPDWLVDEHDSEPIIGSPRIITTEHYMNLMKEPEEEVVDDLAETADSAQLPDWLSDLATPPGGEEVTQSEDRSTADDALSEWLAGISGEGAADSQPAAEPSSPDEPDQPEPAEDLFVESDGPSGELPEDEADVEPVATDSSAGFAAEDQALGSEMFDWMSENLAETGPLGEASLPEEEADTDLDDWLTDLSAMEAADTEAEAELLDFDESDSLTDWLEADEPAPVDDDRLADLTDAVAQQDMDAPDEALPGWMAELTGQEEMDEGDTAVPDEEPLPDWMSEFTTADADQFEEEISAKLEALDEADLAPPAAESEAGTTAESADLGATEDDGWLDDLTAAAAEKEEQPPAAAAPDMEPTETGPLPDWLTGDDEAPLVAETGDEESLFTDLFAPDEAADEVLDWITDEEPAATPPAEAEMIGDETTDDATLGDTDWLSEMIDMGEDAFAVDEDETAVSEEAEPTAEPEAIPEETELTAAADLFTPDWSEEEAEETPPEAEVEAEIGDSTWGEADSLLSEALDEELPDWIEELGPPVAGETPAAPEEELSSTTSLPDWIAQMKPDSVFSDTGLTDSTGLPDLSEDMPDLTDEMITAELPDWLQAETDSGAAAAEDRADIPDWLDMETEAGPAEGGLFGLGSQPPDDAGSQWAAVLQNLPPAAPIEDRLFKADIPDWILALKPSEEIEEEETTEPLESGPLAGLSNVLEMETAVIEPHGNGAMASFTVTPEQQSQAALLKQLALADRKVAQTVGATETAPSGWIRLVLAGLLLLAIIVGLLRPDLLQRPPAVAPAYLEAVHAVIEENGDAPVLLAIEYTPAMSAELDPQVAMLLDQLTANNNSIVTVSQSAAGTAVIQRVAGDYPTLGLLPGQAVGLRQLSDCLAAACPTLSGRTLASSMQQSLTDVALIIVLTGERDSLVDWLEQVALTRDIPLVAGVTQSLGPVAGPYLDSNQLQGMIAGLPDTAVYQQELLGQSPDSNVMRQLSAQTLGQLLAAILLLAGGLIYGVANLIKRENSS